MQLNYLSFNNVDYTNFALEKWGKIIQNQP